MKKTLSVIAAAALISALPITPAYAMGCGMGYGRGAYPQGYAAQDYFALPEIDIEALVEERAERLDGLVADEIVTQEYADAALEDYRAMLEYRAANGFGRGYGFEGGMYGEYGGGYPYGGGCGGYGGYCY